MRKRDYLRYNYRLKKRCNKENMVIKNRKQRTKFGKNEKKKTKDKYKIEKKKTIKPNSKTK